MRQSNLYPTCLSYSIFATQFLEKDFFGGRRFGRALPISTYDVVSVFSSPSGLALEDVLSATCVKPKPLKHGYIADLTR